MELVSTMEINGEEREISDAYARGKIDASNVATVSGMSYSAENDEIIINSKMQPNATVADRVNWHDDALNGVFDTMTAVKQNIKETCAIKDDFNDCGLNNIFDGEWVQGYIGDIALDGTGTSGVVYISTSKVSSLSKNFISCKNGDRIDFVCDDEATINVGEFKTASLSEVSTYGATYYNINKISHQVEGKNTKYILFSVRGKTPDNIGKVRVYINNKLYMVCSQVGNISFSVSGSTLTIKSDTKTWTLTAN